MVRNKTFATQVAWIGPLVALAPFGLSNSTQQALMMPTVPRRPQKRGLLHNDKQYNTLTVLVAVLTDYHICCWPTAITTTTDTSQSILHIWFPLHNLHFFFFEFMFRSFPSRLHLDSLAAAQVPDYTLDGSKSTSLIYRSKRRPLIYYMHRVYFRVMMTASRNEAPRINMSRSCLSGHHITT